jgi:hypothetical protein
MASKVPWWGWPATGLAFVVGSVWLAGKLTGFVLTVKQAKVDRECQLVEAMDCLEIPNDWNS